MVTTIYTCDLCKKEVSGKLDIKEIEIPVSLDTNYMVKTKKMKLCFKCLKEFVNSNNKFIGED